MLKLQDMKLLTSLFEDSKNEQILAIYSFITT